MTAYEQYEMDGLSAYSIQMVLIAKYILKINFINLKNRSLKAYAYIFF